MVLRSNSSECREGRSGHGTVDTSIKASVYPNPRRQKNFLAMLDYETNICNLLYFSPLRESVFSEVISRKLQNTHLQTCATNLF
jgi:hypothetical protein